MTIERDSSQPDASRPAANPVSRGVGDVDLKQVERLLALSVGPPELRSFHEDFGATAVDLLFEPIEHASVPDPQRVYAPELIVRESSRRTAS